MGKWTVIFGHFPPYKPRLVFVTLRQIFMQSSSFQRELTAGTNTLKEVTLRFVQK
jgi:hypothetical protein